MKRRQKNMIYSFASRLNPIKYACVFLLCMIFLTIVCRRDTLISRIQNSELYLQNLKDISYLRTSKRFSKEELNRTVLIITNNGTGHKNMEYDMKYSNPIPPWEHDYYENLYKPDYPILFKKRMVQSINCAKIINGSQTEISRAKKLENDYLTVLSPDYYEIKSQNCKRFLENRQYILDYLTDEELDFPIAYSIVIYKSVYQFERLLRAIYRPQNYYCVHADAKMSDDDIYALTSILKCFNNVKLSSIYFDVEWGDFSVLAADLVCMKDLLEYKKWKYFINLTGQEFPLKTNAEIVKILKSYKGANDVNVNHDENSDWSKRWRNKGFPPNGITPYKGSVHIAVNRDFVEYAVKNETAISLLKWLANTSIPDETFFATLNHNPSLGIRGSYGGTIQEKSKYTKGDMARLKRWHYNGECDTGKFVHQICIISLDDLPFLVKRPEMFVNKLFWDYDHYALDCLEEYLYNKTVDGYNGMTKFDSSEYSKLHFVKHAVQ